MRDLKYKTAKKYPVLLILKLRNEKLEQKNVSSMFKEIRLLYRHMNILMLKLSLNLLL